MKLSDKIMRYTGGNIYPYHMPGHKRRMPDALQSVVRHAQAIDVTELEASDDLHNPQGIIAESMAYAREVYNSQESFFLVNGSTSGILSAIRSCVDRESTILMARNSHISAYHGVELAGCKVLYYNTEKYTEGLPPSSSVIKSSHHVDMPKYVPQQSGSSDIPEHDRSVQGRGLSKPSSNCESSCICGESNSVNISDTCDIYSDIKVANMAKLLADNYKNVSAIYITSPTYEGVISDISSLAALAHSYNIPLIVDEAHGAALSFYNKYSDLALHSALDEGADIVVQSLHKTLPSLTQTAILHVNSKFIDIERLRQNLRIFTSSSPSYILLSSIDACIHYMNEEAGEAMRDYIYRLRKLRSQLVGLKHLRLWKPSGVHAYDIGKLVIIIENDVTDIISGEGLKKLLREDYGIEIEMASIRYIIAMSSLCDSEEGFELLGSALYDIDRRLAQAVHNQGGGAAGCKVNKADMELDVYKGSIAKEDIYVYPPGIPIVCKGEMLDESAIEEIRKHVLAGSRVIGI